MNLQSLLRITRKKNLAAATMRRSPARRPGLRVESLEERAVPATLPAPLVDQTSFRVVGGSADLNDGWSPAMAADPTNPNNVFMAFVTHKDTGTRIALAFSTNGGTSWSELGWIQNDYDPKDFPSLVRYTDVSDPSVSWDRFGNVFLAYNENDHTGADGFASGQVLLWKFAFAGTNTSVVGNGPVSMYQWVPGIINSEAFYVNVAVDSNLGSFQDPDVPGATGLMSDPLAQSETAANQVKVFVTWSMIATDISGNKVGTDSVVMRYSPNGGILPTPAQGIWQAPLLVNDDGYALNGGGTDHIQSKIVFTPGRTGDANSGGRMVTVMSRTGGGINPTIQTDSLKFGGTNGVPLLSGFTPTPGTLPFAITDAIAGQNGAPDQPVPTIINIPVSGFAAGSRIDSLSLDLGINHQDLTQLDAVLQAPTGQKIHLFLNRTFEDGTQAGDGRGLSGTNLTTSFSDGAPFPINQGAQPYGPFWLPEEVLTSEGLSGKDLAATFGGITGTAINGNWKLIVTDHRNGSTGSVNTLKLWIGQGIKNHVGVDRNTGATIAVPDEHEVSHPTKPAFAPNSGVGPGISLAVNNSLGAFSPWQNRIYMAYSTGSSVQVLYSDGVDANSGQLWNTTPITVGPGYLPEITVDPVTGTVALAYYSAQYDASGTRSTMMMSTAINEADYLDRTGTIEFSAGSPVTAFEQTFDQIRSKVITTEPVPSNGPAASDSRMWGNEFGLSVFNGRVQLVYPGNLDIAGTQLRTQDIHIADGPRVVSGDSGPILGDAQTNSDFTGTVNYNGPSGTDGRNQFTGFVITFDRIIDPNTIDPTQVKVIYRSPTDDPVGQGTTVNVTSVKPLDDILDPVTGRHWGSKRFFVLLTTPQTAVGTYSYLIGSSLVGVASTIKDRIRSRLISYANSGATQTFSFNPPPPGPQIQDYVGTPPNGTATPLVTTVTVPGNAFPAGVVISDITVTVNITHTADSDLQFDLIAPNGRDILLMNAGDAFGQNFTGTKFNDSATDTIATTFDPAPYPNTYKPVNSLLTNVFGDNPAGTWTLVVTDQAPGDTGTLNSWSVTIQGATRSTTNFNGNFMDQNANGITNELPANTANGVTAPDGFAMPIPSTGGLNPIPFKLPYTNTNLPISIPGPRLISTHVQGQVATSTDQLVKDQPVSSIDVTFDRTIDASTFTPADVLRITGPLGEIPLTGVAVTPIDSTGTKLPSGTNSKSFRIDGFAAQTLTGTYMIQLASQIADTTGNKLDTNFNAGVGNLEGQVANGDVTTVPYGGNALNGGSGFAVASKSTVSVPLTINDAYLLQKAIVNLTVTFPTEPTNAYKNLEGRLVAPDGTTVLLFSGAPNSGAGNMTNLTLTDDSFYTPTSPPGSPPQTISPIEDGFTANGFNNPTQPLAQLIGHASNGTWKLVIKNNGSATATISKFALNLDKPVIPTGLGEDVADRAVVSFRIANTDGSTNVSKDNWSPVGPAPQLDSNGTNSTAGRVSSIAVDPSDPSGNTVYAAGASGGVWRTTNFLTRDPDGPTWVPLTDFGPDLNVGYLAVYNSPTDPNTNGDPEKTVILVGTGSQALNVIDSSDQRRFDGVGFLLSEDAGKTWQVLDSTDNYDTVLNKYRGVTDPSPAPIAMTSETENGTTVTVVTTVPHNMPVGSAITVAGSSVAGYNGTFIVTSVPSPTTFTYTAAAGGLAAGAGGTVTATDRRNHFFVGTVINKIVYEQNPNVFTNRPIIWAAVGAGVTPASANMAGLWRSMDGGRTWQLIKAGEATDFVLAPGSQQVNSGDRPTIAYLALQGDGVYFTQNLDSQNPSFSQMVGGVGRPTINTGTMPVIAPPNTPNGAFGKITLATPAVVRGDALANNYYQRWLYVAVSNTDGTFHGLYMTKDRGLNWTRVKLTGSGGFSDAGPDVDMTRNPSPPGANPGPSAGNHSLTLTVDPTDPNIVYLASDGLMKIDTTLITDPYNLTMYNYSNDEGGQRPDTFDGVTDNSPPNNVVGGGLISTDPNTLLNSFVPATGNFQSELDRATRKKWNQLNLDRDPYTPFRRDTALSVTNVAQFNNDGRDVTWTLMEQGDAAVPPEQSPYDFSTVSQALTFIDPITGMARMVFAGDEGITTFVANPNGPVNETPNGSENSINGFNQQFQVQNDTNFETDVQVNGNRNGNIQVARFYSGGSQPSLVAASVAQSLYYGAARRLGDVQVSPADPSEGAIVWNDQPIPGADPGAVVSRPTPANYVTTDQTGTGNVYILRRINDMPFAQENTVNFFQISKFGGTPTSFTNGLFQTNADAQGAGQWTNEVKTFAVNPIDPSGIVIGSAAGRLFLTRDMGANWNPIAEPSTLDGNNVLYSAFAFGAPPPNSINLNNFIYAGSTQGNIWVSTTGGGNLPNSWINITSGIFGNLDGSPIQKIIPNPTRGSHELFAITRKGIYHMADWDRRDAQNNRIPTPWENITDNIRSITYQAFGHPDWVIPVLGTDNPNQTGDAGENPFTAMAVDWRPTWSPIVGNPVLYVGGQGGVFRAVYNGPTTTWSRFTGTADGAASDGGGLPIVTVTDIDLALGNIDPNTGRPIANGSPDRVVVSTLGRGMWTIGLDVPPGVSGPKVVFASPISANSPNSPITTGGISSVWIDFDKFITVSSVQTTDFSLVTPTGKTINPFAVTDVTVPAPNQPNLHNDWRIDFNPALTDDGQYTLIVGPNITSGTAKMNQNGNLINGEVPGDEFLMTIVVGANDLTDFVGDSYRDLLNRTETTAEYLGTNVTAMDTARTTALGTVIKTLLGTYNSTAALNGTVGEARQRLIERLVSNGGAPGEFGNLLPGFTLTASDRDALALAMFQGKASPETIARDFIATTDVTKPWFNYYFVTKSNNDIDTFLKNLYADLYPGLGINPITMLPTKTLATQKLQAATPTGRNALVTSLLRNSAVVTYYPAGFPTLPKKTVDFRTNFINMAYAKYLPTYTPTLTDLNAARGLMARGGAPKSLGGSELVIGKILSSKLYFNTKTQADGLPDDGLHTDRSWTGGIIADRMYRTSTSAERDTFSQSVLVSFTKQRTAFVKGLVTTDEYRKIQINAYFNLILGRPAGTTVVAPAKVSELQGWVTKLAAGTTYASLVASLIGSTEYFGLHTNPHDPKTKQMQDWAKAVYQTLLPSPPSPAPTQAQLDALVNKAKISGRTIAANIVINGQEFRDKIIKQFFLLLLNRTPSPNELAGYEAMINASNRWENVIIDMLGNGAAKIPGKTPVPVATGLPREFWEIAD
jgi:subtilisin-like proprotein convertase family protein